VDPVKQIRPERRTSPAIEVRGLKKSYRGQMVLDGIDLTVETGESLVILGGSGSGKSTLLRCMLGLERPDAGSVRLQGIDLLSAPLAEVRELRQRLGMAFQGSALFGSLTLAENVDLPALLDRGFREVETPVLLSQAGGASSPFSVLKISKTFASSRGS